MPLSRLPIVPAGSTKPAGILVLAGTTVPALNIVPAGIVKPGGNVVPAGTVVPAGITVPAGIIDPAGNVVPPTTTGILMVKAPGVVKLVAVVSGTAKVPTLTIAGSVSEVGAVTGTGLRNSTGEVNELFSTELPPPKKISGRSEKLSDTPIFP